MGGSLLDGALYGPLGFGVSGVGSWGNLSDASGGRLLPVGERVVSSVVLRDGVRCVDGGEKGQEGGEDSKTVGEHCELVGVVRQAGVVGGDGCRSRVVKGF